MNGAVSNVSVTPYAVATLGRELRHGGYDVVHVHEPNAPVVSWYAVEAARVAGRRDVPLLLDEPALEQRRRADRRAPALQQAPRARGRVRGGPLDGAALLRRPLPDRPERRRPRPRRARARTRARDGAAPASSSSAAPRSARACPVLLRAFEGLRAIGVDARLTVAGATAEEVQPFLLDTEGIEIAGRVTEDEKWSLLARGRPALRAVARRRELRHGADRGVRLRHAGRVPRTSRATATSSATGSTACSSRRAMPIGARRGAAFDSPATPSGAPRCASSARERAERFAWPRVAGELVSRLRGGGRDVPEPSSAAQRARRARRGAQRRPRAARSRPPDPVARAGRPGRRAAARRSASPAQRGRRRLRGARPRADRARARPHRAQADRQRAARRDAGLGARRVRADVRVDADPRRGVARRPAGGASERARAPARRRARAR